MASITEKMTAHAATSRDMAKQAAEKLRRRNPDHELLRLMTGGDEQTVARRDLERAERFWDKRYGDIGCQSKTKIDAVTYARLAHAMEDACNLSADTKEPRLHF